MIVIGTLTLRGASNNTGPKVLVITIVANAAATLKATIRSAYTASRNISTVIYVTGSSETLMASTSTTVNLTSVDCRRVLRAVSVFLINYLDS